MPNHITNKIRFGGDPDRIKQMLREIAYTEGPNIPEIPEGVHSIDFAKILPQPEHIYHGPLGKEEREMYGKNNWYDWNCANWGTPGNSYGYPEKNEDENLLVFDSNSVAPHPIIKKLSELYPDISINHKWADEDIGMGCGERDYLGGKVLYENFPDYGKAAVDFACEVIGTTPAALHLVSNVTETDYINTEFHAYELIEVLDQPALFSNARLTLEDVPAGMFLYHTRHSDDGSNHFCSLEKKVLVNHSGSILTTQALDFGGKDYIAFTDETAPNFTGDTVTLGEFLRGEYTLHIDQSMGGM